ncbi:MAG: uridine kinase [Candidatus Cloacimonetes bacterium]|nr:uridine kinase [Candidatus Cloacimonadota bacterium]
MSEPLVIGIAGGTGSGKTTITGAIASQVGEHIALLSQDAYYRSYTHLSLEERSRINFDHPDTLDNDLLIKHIRALKRNVPVQTPIYDFHQHLRLERTVNVQPAPILIVEGILIFEYEPLRSEMDIRIFVDTASDIRILRRIERDINERGRSLESVMQQYRETVRPMHIEFVEPTKRFADIIIPEGGFNKIGVDMIVARIRDIMQDHQQVS